DAERAAVPQAITYGTPRDVAPSAASAATKSDGANARQTTRLKPSHSSIKARLTGDPIQRGKFINVSKMAKKIASPSAAAKCTRRFELDPEAPFAIGAAGSGTAVGANAGCVIMLPTRFAPLAVVAQPKPRSEPQRMGDNWGEAKATHLLRRVHPARRPLSQAPFGYPCPRSIRSRDPCPPLRAASVRRP